MKPIIPITLLFFLVFFPQASQANNKTWCWTKPVKTDKFQLDPRNGGENWGYCQAGGKGTIDTAESADSYYLQIFGEEGRTSEILLTNEGFQLGSTTIIKEKAVNVGDLTKLRLRTSGNFLIHFLRRIEGVTFLNFF